MLKIQTTGVEQYMPGGEARLQVMVIGGPGSGKRLDVDTRVATPTGWRRYGDLQVGDEVVGCDGRATKVAGVFDHGRGLAYRVTFNDGASVVADPEHRWAVQTRKLRETTTATITVTTQDMVDQGVRSEREGDRIGRYKFFMPLVAPVQTDKIDLPVEPYLLGTLLANGSFSSDVVAIATNDAEVIVRCQQGSPQLRFAERTYATSTCRRWVLHRFHGTLAGLGLDRLLSRDKFVPAGYLTAHEDARRELLAGLLDSDGSCSPARRACYHTTSRRLAEGVQELVWSLGGVARIDANARTPVEYTVCIWTPDNPFRLPRKAERYAPRRWFRAVTSIEPVGEREMRCIAVEAQDERYVVDGYVVTLNTRYASYWPRPFYIDCEAGLAAVADRKVPFVEVSGSADMLQVLKFLKQETLRPRVDRQFETVVVDTLDAFQRKVKDEWLQANPGSDSFSGYDAWGYLDAKMQMLMTRLLNLDMNVIVNVHYTDKTYSEGSGATKVERHELQLQLQGSLKDSAFNDFDLVGWMGTYFVAGESGREQHRGLTFRAVPDKPFLKDRLYVTPEWMEVRFAPDDYSRLFDAYTSRLDDLPDSGELGEVPDLPDERPIAGKGVVGPLAGGALPPVDPKELPIDQHDKATLLKMARAIPELADKVKANTLKGELVKLLEDHRESEAQAEKASKEVKPDVQQPPPAPTATPDRPDQHVGAPPAASTDVQSAPALETVPHPTTGEPVDTSTGEVLTVQQLAERLDAEVVSTPESADAEATPAPDTAPVAQDSLVCAECGKALAGENQDYVKLSYIKFRRYLCAEDYRKAKSAR